jgi:RNA polymerase sigma factor (sigma-70 family)
MASATLPLIVRPSSDDALARRIAEGDEAAFAILYQRYRTRIERYCRSIVRHDEDALDAAQNTLVKALVAIRAGRQAPTVVPWLFHIARNEAISVLRGRRPQSELLESLTDRRDEPAGQALLREELRATVDSVRALSDRSREALILREVAGLRYEQVADALGVSSGAARQAVHEARRTLLADRAGRDEACEVIRAALEERDGRRRNTRTVRAHLRSCGPCRAWRDDHAAIAGRRMLAVPGAAGGLSSWLAGLLGTGATGGATVAGIGVNAKVLASVAVVALSVTPAAEHALARPIVHVAPVHHARHATAHAPAAFHPAARPVAAVARSVERVAAARVHHRLFVHGVRPRAVQQPVRHPQRRDNGGQGTDYQQVRHRGDGQRPRDDGRDGDRSRGDDGSGGQARPREQQPPQPDEPAAEQPQQQPDVQPLTQQQPQPEPQPAPPPPQG